MGYFIDQQLFFPNQYGFTPGCSTGDYLIDFTEEITASLDQGNVVYLFLDRSKAFDAVYHHILLEKLKFYGLQQYEVNWFRSYLCSRKQQAYVNGVKSDFYPISPGLPEDFILGPLLFFVYINDFPNSTPDINSHLHAVY